MQVIVWPQESGVLAVCIPTGELPIESVIEKDVPAGVSYHIESIDNFPIGLDTPLFDSVRYTNGNYVIDVDAAKNIVITYMNNVFRVQSRIRADNEAIGIPNDPSDVIWLQYIQEKRAEVTNASTIEELKVLLQPYLK